MTRPLRIEFNGAVYHITSRGNAKQTIFLDEKDFADFLGVLCQVVKRYHLILHAFCLMNNHYHLLIETPEGNLSRGMRQLNGLYTQRFNQRHQRVGHLLQGRYKAILVDKDNYLLELCRYVVLNPVRAKIVKDPKDWKWSAYRATIGYKGIPCLTTDWILSQFGNEKKAASRQYQEFVYSGIKAESPLKVVKGQLFLGQDNFMDKMKSLIAGKEKLKEIPREQRYITRPPLKEIFDYKDKESKDQAMYEACLQYGYTLKDIAEYIDVHYTTVSRVIKKIEGENEK
ncbi:addiction module toxin RelE [candidate division NPL-UPA2 bacterium Unc8]|uniref:Addiction module toxin RelE n=1 Tax=candidate division NPL-UPA2 bacterium Unc8 TaxID=1980939 RepID=A0A399FZA6_UNCN2|nr:MAG: addiction module toxin RelE [candidate division NPL-UPA2 bacterium Unc8]